MARSLLALLLAASIFPGCVTAADRERSAIQWMRDETNESPGLEANFAFKLSLDDEKLAELDLEDLEDAGRFSVAAQPSLAGVAAAVASRVGEAFDRTMEEIGLAETLPARWVFLSSEIPPLNVAFEFESGGSAMTVPLLVTPGASPEEVLRDNATLIVVMVHEVVEATLVVPRHGPFVVGDLYSRRGRLVLAGETRWFRDGLAHYAALRTGEHLAAAGGVPFTEAVGPLFSNQPVMRALALRSGGLRDWRNGDGREGETADYAAALGAFLRIRSEFGAEGLRAWIMGLCALDAEGRFAPVRRAELDATFKRRFGVPLQVWLDRGTGGTGGGPVPRSWPSPPSASVVRGDGLRFGVLVSDGTGGFTFVTEVNGRPLSSVLEHECLAAGLASR